MLHVVETALPGVVTIEGDRVEDERGFFVRTYARDEFIAHGLDADIAECSVSFNRAAGTLRGMHYQSGDAAEAKLIRCNRGRVFDVAVDVRPESASYLKWTGVELSEDDERALFIPQGFAHGFVTLEAKSSLFYQISTPYSPQCARGVRWDDPAIGIKWPMAPRVISERDRTFPLVQS